ncbi:conserved oligomeric Golgi complex subunit 4-like [Artemia franciscana]|uniref:Conserved oligomeric Golgi complex subunit 4 n=1 Tax=Artemia franciscana TaxID=6661 RepID=A0AA88I7Q9_ARTSF|nr:hypothetical protein QYM36_003162 [Artemia franciscana]
MNVEARISAIIMARDALRNQVKALIEVEPMLDSAATVAKELHDKTTSTAILAEKVSAKVRSLDMAKARVEECQKRVGDILSLQACHSGVVAAMESEDYETAVGYVHRFLAIDMAAIKGAATDKFESAATEYAVKQLLEAKKKLCEVVCLRFDEAVNTKDAASVERYFKMFAMLNMEEGLLKFASYLSEEVSVIGKETLSRARLEYEEAKGSKTPFANALTNYLEHIAKIIDMRQPIAETYYGPGHLLTFVEVLQKECDKHATAIVKAFKEAGRIDSVTEQIKDHLRNKSSTLDKPDLKLLAPMLIEITVLSARAEMYAGFLRRRIMNDIEVGIKDPEIKKESNGRLESMLRGHTSLNHCIQEIISSYIVLEQYVLTEKLKKAITMDTKIEGSPTSSLVDDTFFVLHEGIMCAISSCHIDAICSVINIAACFIEEQIAQSVAPQVAWPTGMMADISQAYSLLQQGRTDIDKIKTQFLISMNNTEMSIQYVDKLIQVVKGEASMTTSLAGEKEQGKLQSCLSLMESSKQSIYHVLSKSRQQLKDGAIRTKLKPVIDSIQNVNHNLTEEEYTYYETHEQGWAADILKEVESVLNSFRGELTEVNFEFFIEDTAKETSSLLEKNIGKIEFTKFGGLLLELEARKIVAYFSALAGWSIRDCFSRIIQIAAILTIEKATEVADLCASFKKGQKTTEFGASEIKNILGLRVDFSRDEVRRLRI